MQALSGIYLASGATDVAGAHTFVENQTFLAGIGHQLFGLHHLPLTLLLLVGGFLWFWHCFNRDSARKE